MTEDGIQTTEDGWQSTDYGRQRAGQKIASHRAHRVSAEGGLSLLADSSLSKNQPNYLSAPLRARVSTANGREKKENEGLIRKYKEVGKMLGKMMGEPDKWCN